MQTRIQRTLKTIKPAPSLRARRARSRDRHTRARHGRPRVEHRIDPARGARRDAANRDQARRRAQGATATRPTRRPRAIATNDAKTTIDRDDARRACERRRRRATTTIDRARATTNEPSRVVATSTRVRANARVEARSIDRSGTRTGRIFARGIRDRSWIIVWGNSEG